jgi:hypothetical protein
VSADSEAYAQSKSTIFFFFEWVFLRIISNLWKYCNDEKSTKTTNICFALLLSSKDDFFILGENASLF